MDGDNKVDAPNPEANKGVATNVNVVMQEASPRRVEHVSPAKTATRPTRPSLLAQGQLCTHDHHSSDTKACAAPPSTFVTVYPMYHVPEDQVGVSKEALI